MSKNLTEFEKSILEAKNENLKKLLILLDYDLYKEILIFNRDEKFIDTLLQYISD